MGIVPVHGQAHKGAKPSGGGQNLNYNGGPVMHTNTVYAIYWVPSGYKVSPNYETLINRFFTDVSADHSSDNVYYSDTQYYDNANGNIQDSSSFTNSNSVVDTNPLPSNGCSDSYTQVCVSDAQIQQEIKKVITAQGWTASPSTEFFMFTADGVGSCYSSSSCAFSQYCAYHSHFGSGSNVTLYANMPYTDTVPAACDSGQYPNGDPAADSTINVTSHEHNETITDEQGNAWYDRRGYENGDKCAWNFGTALSGASGSEYNQVINGHDYYLQREWSNHSSGCVLTGI